MNGFDTIGLLSALNLTNDGETDISLEQTCIIRVMVGDLRGLRNEE